jgi:hypothetical protein
LVIKRGLIVASEGTNGTAERGIQAVPDKICPNKRPFFRISFRVSSAHHPAVKRTPRDQFMPKLPLLKSLNFLKSSSLNQKVNKVTETFSFMGLIRNSEIFLSQAKS